MERNSTTMENSTEQTTTTTTTPADDLQTRLAAATQVKTPGAPTTVAPKNSFWNASEEDFEIPKTKEQKPEVKTDPETKTDNPNQPTGPVKLTEKLKIGSATTAVGMIDFTNRLLITPIHTFKLKKKLEKTFTDQQLDLIDQKLFLADDKTLADEELRLKNRFASIMQKYEAKTGKIAMSEPEKANLHAAFYNYFDVTQKTLSPNWYLGLELVNLIGGRVVDAITE